MEYWSDGAMGQNRQFATRLIYFWVLLMPVLVNAQTKSIIIGEGVRGAIVDSSFVERLDREGMFDR
jgi:hypothetical protein